jgi:hypothetical protein
MDYKSANHYPSLPDDLPSEIKALPVKGADKEQDKISIPESLAGKELQIILEVSDNAQHQLKKYHRTISHIPRIISPAVAP